MREIKFRAWDKKRQCWNYSVEAMELDADGILCTSDNYAVMQYTGLKDKNGKEIYEGDVVQSEGIDGKLLWEVRWGELDMMTGFGYYPIEHTFSCIHNRVDDIGEIIGNIYENPELLNE